MKNNILKSNMSEKLKDKMVTLFENADMYISEHAQEAANSKKIYLPVELTFNNTEDKIVRVGLVNDLYFENGKDLDNLDIEFSNEEFNQFDENGVVDGLISINLENDKCIIFMPAIYLPKDHNGEGERVIFLGHNLFFN